jgi:hypothetical protein
MADIASFPTIRDVLVSGDNIKNFTAGAAITAGQVVAFAGTGVDNTVHPVVTTSTGSIVGVALYSVASGAQVAVACRGCLCTVANGESDATGDAGDPVAEYGTTTAGTVKVAPIAAAGATCTLHKIVGYLMEDMANSSTPVIEVAPGYLTQPNAS